MRVCCRERNLSVNRHHDGNDDPLERCAVNFASTHLSTDYSLAVYPVPRLQGWGTMMGKAPWCDLYGAPRVLGETCVGPQLHERQCGHRKYTRVLLLAINSSDNN